MARNITGILFCAKCHKPVDRVESAMDPWTGGYAFTAFCHGATDSCIIDRQTFAEAISVECAEAFSTDRVDSPR